MQLLLESVASQEIRRLKSPEPNAERVEISLKVAPIRHVLGGQGSQLASANVGSILPNDSSEVLNAV